MHASRSTTLSRLPLPGALSTLLLVLALALALPAMAVAQEGDNDSEPSGSDGPGTEYFQCRSDAVDAYDRCRIVVGTSWTGKLACRIALDLDNIGCNVDLLEAMIPGGNE